MLDTSKSIRVYKAYEKLFSAIKEGNVQHVLSVAYDYLGYGIVLTDSNFYLLGQYPKKEIGDKIWDILYKKRVLPYDIGLPFLEMYNNNRKPVFANEKLVGNFHRILGAIYENDIIIGYMALFLMENELQDDDLEIAQIILDALTIKMSRGIVYQPALSTYMLDMLNPSTTIELKEWVANELGKKIPSSYIIIVSKVEKTTSQIEFAKYIAAQILKKYINAVSTYYEGVLVTLLGNINKELFKSQENVESHEVIHFLKKSFSVNSISDFFNKMNEIPFRYQQALLTSKIGEKSISTYSSTAPQQMYLYIAQNIEPRTFIHPALFEMFQYDQENSTNYFDTLREYCFSMQNIVKTAKSLYIHRNTLVYRLTRIEKLFDIDLNNEQTVRYLLSSYELWQGCLLKK